MLTTLLYGRSIARSPISFYNKLFIFNTVLFIKAINIMTQEQALIQPGLTATNV